MSTAIAITTYNRHSVLLNALQSIKTHMPNNPVAIFDDGSSDGTAEWLQNRCDSWEWSSEYEAYYGVDRNLAAFEAFAGPNLGVAGNSNRALRWFLKSKHDHLLLCNDDVVFRGNAGSEYARAHTQTGIGLFCLCNFGWKGYETAAVTVRGVPLLLLTRLTGALQSITRETIERIGYFVPDFGKFGEEHCDYAYRAAAGGLQALDAGAVHPGIDIPNPSAGLQVTDSSIPKDERPALDRIASDAMARQSVRYGTEGPFRPYRLRKTNVAANRGSDGLPIAGVRAAFVHGRQPDPIY